MQKWVKKGESQEALGEEPHHEEEVEDLPEISTRHEGPYYDRKQLLRNLGSLKKSTALDDPGMQITVGDRPEEEHDDDGRTPGARRAQKEAAKSKKRGVEEEQPQALRTTSEMDMAAAMSSYAASMNPMMMAYMQSMSYAAQMYSATGTTVMLRNIPNRYTRDMLVDRLKKGYDNSYDFLYLPIDFGSKCNVGYAFINFKSPATASKFIAEFHSATVGNVLPGFSSSKVCEVSYAHVQGRDANLENLRDRKFIDKLREMPEWQPLFYDDRGKEIPFSMTFAPSLLQTHVPGATSETMMMVKNVPPELTKEKVVEVFDKKFKGAYNFLYVPEDTKKGASAVGKGFCFANFVSAEKAAEFTAEFSKKNASECFGVASEKEAVCEVEPARLNAVERSIEKLQAPPREDKKEKAKDKDKDKDREKDKDAGENEGEAPVGDEGEKSAAAETKEEPKEEGKEEEETKAPVDKTAWHPLLFSAEGEPKPFPIVPATPGAKKGASLPAGASGATPSASSKGDAKGKGKGKGKGKNPYGMPMMGFGYPPYGYGYDPRYAAAYAAAYHQAAAQHAHAHAAAAAAARAVGQGSMLESMAAAMNNAPGRGAKPLKGEQKKNVMSQIEFYFSDDNLCKDVYLRSHMDSGGWTSLDLISQFNQVKKYRTTVESIAEALTNSTKLEVDTSTRRVRLKDEALRNKWAKASQELNEHIEATTPKGA